MCQCQSQRLTLTLDQDNLKLNVWLKDAFGVHVKVCIQQLPQDHLRETKTKTETETEDRP